MFSRSFIVGSSAGALSLAFALSSSAIAAPFTGWQHPYQDNQPLTKVLLHFNESSGTNAANTGDKVAWGTSDGTYSADASSNVASGAGIPGGDFGNAFDTDGGTKWIEVPSAPSLAGAFTNGFIVETWFKANSLADSYIASQYDHTQSGFPGGRQWALQLVGGKVYFGSFRSDGVLLGQGYGTDGLYSTSTVTTGTWHHVAAVYDDGTPGNFQWKLYLDGQLQTSLAYGAWGFTTNAIPLVIGAYSDHTANFDGEIDEFRISNGHLQFAVPEPASMSLLALGGLMLVRRRRK